MLQKQQHKHPTVNLRQAVQVIHHRRAHRIAVHLTVATVKQVRIAKEKSFTSMNVRTKSFSFATNYIIPPR